MIEGVIIKKLKKISDERGTIFKMQQSSDEEFKGFGEIYFSTVYPGVVKGWHLHEETYLNYAVIKGMIKLVLFDDRENSSTKGEIQEIYIGEQNYCLVQIPPKVWNGFKGIGNTEAIVANCATIPHDPDEIERMDPLKNSIPYNWELKNK